MVTYDDSLTPNQSVPSEEPLLVSFTDFVRFRLSAQESVQGMLDELINDSRIHGEIMKLYEDLLSDKKLFNKNLEALALASSIGEDTVLEPDAMRFLSAHDLGNDLQCLMTVVSSLVPNSDEIKMKQKTFIKWIEAAIKLAKQAEKDFPTNDEKS